MAHLAHVVNVEENNISFESQKYKDISKIDRCEVGRFVLTIYQ